MAKVIINGFEYEIGSPNGKECPTIQACLYCHFMRGAGTMLANGRLCLFPKALYGNVEAYREYKNTQISLEDLIKKHSKTKQ